MRTSSNRHDCQQAPGSCRRLLRDGDAAARRRRPAQRGPQVADPAESWSGARRRGRPSRSRAPGTVTVAAPAAHGHARRRRRRRGARRSIADSRATAPWRGAGEERLAVLQATRGRAGGARSRARGCRPPALGTSAALRPSATAARAPVHGPRASHSVADLAHACGCRGTRPSRRRACRATRWSLTWRWSSRAVLERPDPALPVDERAGLLGVRPRREARRRRRR